MTSLLALGADPDHYVSPQELADHWRVSRRTVYRLLSKGSLPYRKVGQQIRVQVEDALQHGRPEETHG